MNARPKCLDLLRMTVVSDLCKQFQSSVHNCTEYSSCMEDSILMHIVWYFANTSTVLFGHILSWCKLLVCIKLVLAEGCEPHGSNWPRRELRICSIWESNRSWHSRIGGFLKNPMKGCHRLMNQMLRCPLHRVDASYSANRHRTEQRHLEILQDHPMRMDGPILLRPTVACVSFWGHRLSWCEVEEFVLSSLCMTRHD